MPVTSIRYGVVGSTLGMVVTASALIASNEKALADCSGVPLVECIVNVELRTVAP